MPVRFIAEGKALNFGSLYIQFFFLKGCSLIVAAFFFVKKLIPNQNPNHWHALQTCLCRQAVASECKVLLIPTQCEAILYYEE